MITEVSSFNKARVATLISTGVAIGAILGSQTDYFDTTPQPSETSHTVPTDHGSRANNEPAVCPSPSPTDISVTHRLLTQPEAHGRSYTYDSVTRDKFYATQAKKAGVTEYSAEPYLDKITDALYSPKARQVPYTFYLRAGQAYMRKLGVDLDIANTADPIMRTEPGSRPLKQHELQSATFANRIIDVLNAYNHMPKEYVELAEQKHVYIVAGTKHAAAYAAATDRPHDTATYIDIQVETVNGAVPLHEFDHLVDSKLCGGGEAATNDPSFIALNGTVKMYAVNNKQPAPTLSYREGYTAFKDKQFSLLERAKRMGNKAGYCRLVQKDAAEAKQVVSYSDYHPDIGEEKAETLKALVQPFTFWNITPRFPVLYRKITLLFARLYHSAPDVARYYAAISYRPHPEEKYFDC